MTLAFIATAGAESATAAPAWKFTVDPALEAGVPEVNAETSGVAEALQYTVTEITGLATSRTMDKRTLPAAKTASIKMPPVERDTFAEISITTAGATKALFEWRTLLRPEGKTILSFTGLDELAPPPDFDAYWDRAKKELAAVPLKPVVTRVPDRDTSTGLLHRVDLPAAGGTTVSAWYFVPRNAFDAAGKAVKKCPAVIVMPGYGAEEPPIDRTTSGMITLSVNPRNHGPSRDFWKSPVEHMLWNIDEPEKYYYKMAFLDGLRGAEFLFSRPEVDKKKVATEGGSQGGLFAIAIASLEPRIACICSNVTAFSAYPEGMRLAYIGHHSQFRAMLADPATSASVKRSLALTDGANMARKVKCPVQINMGGIDPVCPYVCGAVIYNSLPAGTVKEIHVVPGARHEVPQPMRVENGNWYRRHLGVE